MSATIEATMSASPAAISRQRSRAIPRRLLLAWGMIAAGFALPLALRGLTDDVTWAWIWSLSFFSFSKAASLIRLDRDRWQRLSWGRLLAYLFWIGLRPEPFLRGAKPEPITQSLWYTGLRNLATGAILLWVVPLCLPEATPWIVRFVIAVVGYGLIFVFALTDLWAALYRALGIPVGKLWVNPPAATSLAEFWGERWNRIFSGFARDMFFHPLARVTGVRIASLSAFVYSALAHEWGWSMSVSEGYGGPALYFLIQGLLLQVESTRLGRTLLRGRPWLGRLWTWLVVVGPLPLAIHSAYVRGQASGMLAGLGVPGFCG